jgi:hypothetical protein
MRQDSFIHAENMNDVRNLEPNPESAARYQWGILFQFEVLCT